MARFSLARHDAPAPQAQPAPVAAPVAAASQRRIGSSPSQGAAARRHLDLRLRLHTRLIDELDLAKLDK
jgi:pilus assembly protein CpaF